MFFHSFFAYFNVLEPFIHPVVLCQLQNSDQVKNLSRRGVSKMFLISVHFSLQSRKLWLPETRASGFWCCRPVAAAPDAANGFGFHKLKYQVQKYIQLLLLCSYLKLTFQFWVHCRPLGSRPHDGITPSGKNLALMQSPGCYTVVFTCAFWCPCLI